MITLRGDDDTTSIWTDELSLLQEIAERSSDLVKARGYPDFAAACGGVEVLENLHTEAVRQWEKWHSDGEG